MELIAPPSMTDDGKLHIVMFPWLAFGHMIPFLEVAKLIAQKGHKISFVSTPRNIDRLPKLPPNLSPLINLVKLPLPTVDNLPENAEATVDLPYDKVKYLKTAYDLLQQPMTQFLQSSAPDWCLLLYIHCLLHVLFGACIIFDGNQDARTKPEDFTVPPKWIPFKSTVAFRLFEILRVFDDVTGDDENIPGTHRVGASIQGCDAFALRSCYDFEPEWLKLLEEIYRKPVIPVGQLPATTYDAGDDDKNDEWKAMKQWLDKQVKGSVVYVAFGSEAKPSQAELTEIALGLELSKLPFFWVFRKRRGLADTEFIELPDGFEERTKRRGLVWTSWAPQLKILSHDSVGGFLTHSGWGSVVEGLQFERALILLTFLAEQGLNARVLEEKKMAYPIPRDDRDGSFTRDSVADSLRLVMVGEGGKMYRDKAKEISRTVCRQE
ncbi:hypothetical protein F0562_003080 [Nyssa sinensis]|uniref:Glycosyltransferase n=1 Tax=Nyssa sinensis TaxID=561372 RepID=A0A5J5BUL6_9ASTE|nr:hypothetical protein F0562_003080 [Nyssa sinensis]